MRLPSLLLCVVSTSLPAALWAADNTLRLGSLFGDHMVWPSGVSANIWGKAAAGAEVELTLSLGNQTKNTRTKAGADGRWKASLGSVPAGLAGMILARSGTEEVKVSDVLTGEVWLCSGQSNMAFNLSKAKDGPQIAKAHRDDKIRLFVVGRSPSPDPQETVQGKWTLATPETVAGFSAVAYHFARERRKTHPETPLGLVGSYWGGTPAEAWTPAEALANEPAFENFAKPYAEKLKAFREAGSQHPKPEKGDKIDESRPGGAKAPSNLYNGMIAPLAPFRFKGVLWYQGEANAGRPAQYARLFPALIQSWRKSFEDPELPFLFVLLAGFQKAQTKPHEGGWAEIREAQLAALSLPNTAAASALDLGDANDIHPTNKFDVGLRLSLAARALVDEEKIPYSGPVYQSHTISGSSLILQFENASNGIRAYPEGPPHRYPLALGGRWIGGYVKPEEPDILILPPADAPIKGFALRGNDGVWHNAQASWQGFYLSVSSPEVKEPVAVSYGWASNPDANAYGTTGLPVTPFRSDSPYPPDKRRKNK